MPTAEARHGASAAGRGAGGGGAGGGGAGRRSVGEVAGTGQVQSDPGGAGGLGDVLIAGGPAGLGDRADPGVDEDLGTVGGGEEGVRGGDRGSGALRSTGTLDRKS